MKKRHYILTAVISYLVLLVATIPAKPITELINNSSPIAIQGVNGSIWDGKAYLITAKNNIKIEQAKWSFKFWQLLLGRLTFDIDARFSGEDISAELGTSFIGRFYINNLSARIAAQDFAQLANIPLAQLSGSISLEIESAQWKQGELPLATGKIIWSDAAVTVTDTASLGNISIQLSESDQQLLNAEIKNQGGDIKINGTAELVPEADYALDLKLLPLASANNNIKQSLRLFAKKQNNGEYILKKSGPLNQIM